MRLSKSAKTQGRPFVIAFGSVVEHNVENDFDTVTVQRLNHVAKFVQWPEQFVASYTPDAVQRMKPARIPSN